MFQATVGARDGRGHRPRLALSRTTSRDLEAGVAAAAGVGRERDHGRGVPGETAGRAGRRPCVPWGTWAQCCPAPRSIRLVLGSHRRSGKVYRASSPEGPGSLWVRGRGGLVPVGHLQGWGTGNAAWMVRAEAGQRRARDLPGAERSFIGGWWTLWNHGCCASGGPALSRCSRSIIPFFQEQARTLGTGAQVWPPGAAARRQQAGVGGGEIGVVRPERRELL